MPLVVADKYGRVIDQARARQHARRRASSDVKLGDQYGAWAGRDLVYATLPGGAMLQFDLSQLTLADFRSMRDHYQINASLTVLSFILHQIDWHIECDDDEIKEQLEDNLRKVWTQLIRALSQAFWAGYSPSVINFENDEKRGYIVIDKFKDMVPEECRVNWKKVDGYAPPGQLPPQFLQYDGIVQSPQGFMLPGTGLLGRSKSVTIPPENSLWYPLLMENGDYYGRKLLRPAFPAWYFSQIIHLFANRYLERFGEPTPIGRAAYDEEVDLGNGEFVTGKAAMETILANLRNRSVVVLPSDRDPVTKEYDYSLEYLESQMRGADFERYLSRLDEEMSLAVFTPVLLFRTADVGSYNLGQAHLKIFLWMLNSVAGDLKFYIQKYVVDRLRVINWGEDAPAAEWVYRKLGKDEPQLYAQLVQALVAGGLAKPDIDELGVAIGLTMTEIEQVAEPPEPVVPIPGQEPALDPDPVGEEDTPAPTVIARHPASLDGARQVVAKAVERAGATIGNGNAVEALGYRRAFLEALVASDADTRTAARITEAFYGTVNQSLADLGAALGSTPERYTEVLGNVVDLALEKAVAA